jgi:SNF2 family DNA or RNA helicase
LFNIETKFVEYDHTLLNRRGVRQFFEVNQMVKKYSIIKSPILNTGSLLYKTNWKCLIIDEIQNYTNIDTIICKALSSIFANYRWGLSGTIINEPSTERMLGYHILINDLSVPRCLPLASTYFIRNYNGMKRTMVIRTKNTEYIEPKINIEIINHTLNENEIKLYLLMKQIFKSIQESIKQFKDEEDKLNTRLYSSGLLSMIIYLRQFLISPLITISSAMLDTCEFKNKSIVSDMLITYINDNIEQNYLANIDSVCSSRIKEILLQLTKYSKKKIILFCSFRTCIDLISSYIKDRNIYILESTQSFEKRQQILKDFENDIPPDGGSQALLFLTYQM